MLPACGKGMAQGDGLPRTDGNQRCTVFLPDLPVGMGAALGTGVEDDAVQDGQPFPAWQVNDARVGEEFAEVGTQGLTGRRIGRAEVDEEDGGSW
ncbi:hypothetical protein HMPREF9080_02530 [Cardiobacterium valvarum F0432]|uniref:Uncharacterized protein n=1 Tax=Cardiobacterium valvarum F0432 TaxID=797473 RepID=G9ZIC0_9GAMM|nr:hypothetical protein HMPREF9080_02530 [Cardiobacterium valvarum F0432]